MRIINLSSGSKGNLTYIESDEKKILLDAGLSCNEMSKRLGLIQISPYDIDAILISHEHSDHTKGIDVFATKYNIPVYAHERVWVSLNDKLVKLPKENKKTFEGNFSLGDIMISPFEVPHDVVCYAFSFSCKQNKISFVTDIGHMNDRILNSIKGSQIVYLEANYDRSMLMNGTKYPLALKRRIDGPNGHLSNSACAETIEFLCQTGTRQVVLSHLSEENNSPFIAYTSICSYLESKGIIEGQHLKIDVATQNPGAFFRLK